MGLSDIDVAVKAYRKLSVGERAVFKSEIRQKRKVKKRKKVVRSKRVKPEVPVTQKTAVKARKRRVRKPVDGPVPVHHPDPLTDIHSE